MAIAMHENAGGDVEILLVSEEIPATERAMIENVVAVHGVGIKTADSCKKAVEDLARNKHSIVILYDFEREGDLKTSEAIRIMKQIVCELLIVAISEERPLEMERELRKSGLYYYLTRPFTEKELKEVISGVIKKAK
jgi:DNA-binding NtrC family response regulator